MVSNLTPVGTAKNLLFMCWFLQVHHVNNHLCVLLLFKVIRTCVTVAKMSGVYFELQVLFEIHTYGSQIEGMQKTN